MSKVLVISGHPNLKQSNTNQIILETLRRSIEDIEIRELDSLYPNYEIDVQAEQAALISADIIVLQFPFYWYSVPALLKNGLMMCFAMILLMAKMVTNYMAKSLFFLSLLVGQKSRITH